jgi:hypothetical protein
MEQHCGDHSEHNIDARTHRCDQHHVAPRIAQRPEVNRDRLRIAKQERRTQEKQQRRQQNRPDRIDVI